MSSEGQAPPILELVWVGFACSGREVAESGSFISNDANDDLISLEDLDPRDFGGEKISAGYGSLPGASTKLPWVS
jgi:hypothetical protein